MKKLTAIILFVVTLCSIMTGCSTEEIVRSPRSIANAAYWEENIYAVDECDIIVGTADLGGFVPENEITEMLKSIDFGAVADIDTIKYYKDSKYGLYLSAEYYERYLQVDFYYDFTYVTVADSFESEPAVYLLNNSDEIKQYYIDWGVYVAPRVRSKAFAFVYQYLSENKLYDIVEISDYSYSTSEKPAVENNLTFIAFNSFNIYAVPEGSVLSDEEQQCCQISCSALYTDSMGKKSEFLISFTVEPTDLSFKIKNSIVHQRIYTSDYPYAAIGGFDYSLWLQNMDNMGYNEFEFNIGSNGSKFTTDPCYNTDVALCLEMLELGKEVDFIAENIPDELVYHISLYEQSPVFDKDRLFTLFFYHDCQYVKICTCDMLHITQCNKTHNTYTVKNPQVAINLFSKHYTYICTEDYDGIVKHAEKYIAGTSARKLQRLSDRDTVLPKDIEPEILRYKIDSHSNFYFSPGTEADYNISLLLWYCDIDKSIYEDYTVTLAVKKVLWGWKTVAVALNDY